MHKPVDPSPRFPALEEEVLEWWKAEGIPQKALAHREGAPEFVFYEGPPYVNAPPGAHNVLPRVIKDIYLRFQSMKGKFVPRMAGWDCHGLPAEVEVEKKLGLKHKREIVEYGVERFNKLCREAVGEYIEGYVKFSDRIAFWLDYENAYQTYSNPYIESVWWSLAEFHRKDLLFEADRIAPYCPRCETPLSDHELGQPDVYRDITDPGVTLRLPLADPPSNLEGASLATWTTTPWTLIANVACAVGPDITYVLIEHNGHRVVVAEALAAKALGLEMPPTPLATFSGKDLVGLHYRPPFEYAKQAMGDTSGDAWRVVAADFVNVEEGTGIVHMAGAFGADDLNAVKANGIGVYKPVDLSGQFDSTVPEYTGTFVKDADPGIIDRLRDAGLLIRSEPYEHSYPHCWRCDSPLLNYALVSWYIRTTSFSDQMISENSEVNWIPPHIREGRFGNWLSNNVDWSLSRFRYWGTPLPIWRCGSHDTAVESVAQLSELAGRDLADLDLHRPFVDEVTFPCPECGQQAERIPDVIDVWYDAGAMSFAQFGYPHRNKEAFESRFPADFIAEALDQTRGWFYSLMAESVGLFGRNAYKTVICHGLILDDEGKKMSKHKEIADPWHIFERYGSDALRFFYLSAGNPADNRRLSEESLQQVLKGPFITLWNVYRLYVLYANIDEFTPMKWEPINPLQRPAIDRWILSELHQLIFEVDESLESYDSLRASRRIVEFIDDLSNWYVRRCRRRFWRPADDHEARLDKSAAYWTLWTCLVELTKLMAPFAPFLAEALYRNLVSEVNPSAPPSVHLTDFPQGDPELTDVRLGTGMAAARELASLGRSARTSAGVKVRQPLAHAVLLVPEDLQDAVEEIADLLADELNVQEMSFAEDTSDLVRLTLRPNFAVAGPDLGPKVRDLAKALEDLSDEAATELAATLEDGLDAELDLAPGETLQIQPDHVDIRREPAEGTAFAYEAPFGISLNLEVSDELRREGLAREFVHQAQMARRDASLEVTDRIELVVSTQGEALDALREFEHYIAEELLATNLQFESRAPDTGRRLDVDGTEVTISLKSS